MNTEELIAKLAADTQPIPRNAALRRLATGLGTGAAVSLAILAIFLGFRPDLAAAASGVPFWAKGAYTATLGLCGLLLTLQLARPESERLRWLPLVAAPLVAVSVLSAFEIQHTAPSERAGLFLDPIWICLPLVMLLAMPLFVGIVWAFKLMAPTRLPAAGAAAGLTAGGFAATIYCLYCQQVSATYVMTRYTLAVGLVVAAGAVIGPRLMRW